DAVRKRQVMQPAQQTDGNVPPYVPDDRLDRRIFGKAPADIGIERRAAALAGIGLPEERLRELRVQTFSSADFACSAMAPKACGSRTARSASTLRSSSIPAVFKPAMNWLYERPFARAPALIRMIQSRRKVRFLFLR